MYIQLFKMRLTNRKCTSARGSIDEQLLLAAARSSAVVSMKHADGQGAAEIVIQESGVSYVCPRSERARYRACRRDVDCSHSAAASRIPQECGGRIETDPSSRTGTPTCVGPPAARFTLWRRQRGDQPPSSWQNEAIHRCMAVGSERFARRCKSLKGYVPAFQLGTRFSGYTPRSASALWHSGAQGRPRARPHRFGPQT